MGFVYKKKVTKKMPSDADISIRESKRFAKWKDRRGKTRTAQLTTGRDGSDRIVVECGTYMAKYRDGEGNPQYVATGCRSKDGAMAVLRDLMTRAERVKAKILSPAEDRIADHQHTPLSEHIADYIAHQISKDRNVSRIKNSRSRLNRVAKDCQFKRLADIDATAMERWLLDRKVEKMSAGARNGFREAWVAFANWCVASHRLLGNPLSGVPIADTKADCRRKRRALTEDELNRLLVSTRHRPLRDAMTIRRGPNKGKFMAKVSDKRRVKLELLGRERALIYKSYLLTGLRKSELASLTVGHLELDVAMPYAVLDAAAEKNGQGSDIPLRGDLVTDLRGWLTEKLTLLQADAMRLGEATPVELPPETPLFYVPTGLLRILNRDLKLAGIAKKDDRGRSIDLHGLRHTFGTHLSKSGVAPRVAQAAMRHSSIDLTMNVYTDPRQLDVHGALDSLPALSLDEDSSEPTAAKATGTDDVAAQTFAPGFAPKTGNSSTFWSTVGNLGDLPSEAKNEENPEKTSVSQGFSQSGRQDLNLRPLRPERSALPG